MVRREGDRPSRRTEDNGGGRRHSRGQHPSGDKRRAARDRRRSSPDKPSGEADLYYDSPSPQRRGRDTGGNDREDRLGQGRHGKVRPKRVSASPAPLVPNSDRSSGASSNLLSADSLARLNALNEKTTFIEKEGVRKVSGAAAAQPGRTTTRKHHQHDKRKRRVVSGPALEEGRARRYDGPKGRMNMTRKRQLLIAIILVALLLVIFIPVGVLVIGKKKDGDGAGAAGDARGDGPPANANLATISESDIPAEAKGTILDPFAWYDTGDFNVTYTAATVGDLPVMGLNSTWDDHTRANDRVPYLDEEWQYGTQPIRGVNVGGWLNVEPFITPSLFRGYGRHLGVVDEYTLTKHLGPTTAAEVLERHYATFVTESTFAEIAAAGLDHVRIPFGYWAVATFADDPYVPQISWRYLLRAIEWARRYGLRVNLDLHGAPGSQNGWNHSGRLGTIGWMNGTDGALNAQRTLEIHDRMSKFFGQDRYRNVVAVYGLLNEPKMSELPQQDMRRWNEQAIRTVRSNGVDAIVAIGDGFLGLPKWKGQLTAYAAQNEVVLDAHQYLIFNADQLAFTHQRKLEFICDGWAGAMRQSVDRSTGFGPTFCGEFSQADTDCAMHLNNVNMGARWTGTYDTGDPSSSVLTPACPAASKPQSPDSPSSSSSTSSSARGCSCDQANAPASQYSDAYKKYLLAFASAQMDAFEQAWGWFYWTWDTEETVQWSWKKGRAAGTIPLDPAARENVCGQPDLGVFVEEGLGEEY